MNICLHGLANLTLAGSMGGAPNLHFVNSTLRALLCTQLGRPAFAVRFRIVLRLLTKLKPAAKTCMGDF